jgi:hypothetical protein
MRLKLQFGRNPFHQSFQQPEKKKNRRFSKVNPSGRDAQKSAWQAAEKGPVNP